MSKKINVLFDATNIFYYFERKNGNRSGVFFTALNILKELIKIDNINIFIYCNEPNLLKKWILLKEELEKEVCCKNIQVCATSLLDQFILKIKRIDQKKASATTNKKYFQAKKYSMKLWFYNIVKYFISKDKTQNNFLKNMDVFFSPVFVVPNIIANCKNIKKYTILYDAIPIILPEYFSALQDKQSWYLRLVNSFNNKDTYFAISQSAKDDFLKHCSVLTKEQIIVTPLACANHFTPCRELTEDSLKKYGLPLDKKYIFSLCTPEPRKNLIRSVKTFIEFIEKNNIDDMVFILGGGSWSGFIEKLESEIPNFDIYRDKILRAGYIDDEDLAPLYSGAEWFVYTSQYEGFGLPPLEAMSCACPVITSNNSSLPEVVGDAGIMIEWDSDSQHIQAYEKYYFNLEYRKQMAQKGYEHSKEFSWKKCVDIMVKEMRK